MFVIQGKAICVIIKIALEIHLVATKVDPSSFISRGTTLV